MYLNYINYFRGFAILMIAMGHSFIFKRENIFEKGIYSIVINGTGLFVFISGFLFYHIFYSRGFNYKKFMINKLKNVLLPYTIISFPMLLRDIYKHDIQSEIYMKSKILYSVLLYYSGITLGSTWYIPFAMLLFIASPLFIKFIKLEKNFQKILILFGIVVGMIVKRPSNDLTVNIFQAFIYFFPYYCLGIYIALNQKELIFKIEKRNFLFGVLWFVFIIFQIYVNNYTSVPKKLFEIDGIDLMIIQKMLMSLFFIGVFIKLEKSNFNTVKKIFNLLGDYSFGIFFLHNYFIRIFWKILYVITKGKIQERTLNFAECFIFGIGVVLCSIVTIWIVKKIFKKKSRYIIGS